MSLLRMLRPGVQLVVEGVLAVVLVSAYVIVFAWGWQQHRAAEDWRRLACEYRATIVERASGLAIVRSAGDACEALQTMGIEVASRRVRLDVP